MFTFERVDCEPEMYLEDYSISYANTGKPFYTRSTWDDEEGYCIEMHPVVSINRKDGIVELYEFEYDIAFPSEKVLILKALLELVDLKNELDIDGYRVIGQGANIYEKLFNRTFI